MFGLDQAVTLVGTAMALVCGDRLDRPARGGAAAADPDPDRLRRLPRVHPGARGPREGQDPLRGQPDPVRIARGRRRARGSARTGARGLPRRAGRGHPVRRRRWRAVAHQPRPGHRPRGDGAARRGRGRGPAHLRRGLRRRGRAARAVPGGARPLPPVPRCPARHARRAARRGSRDRHDHAREPLRPLARLHATATAPCSRPWPPTRAPRCSTTASSTPSPSCTMLQDQLQHQAHHDPLTGLATRSLFSQQVREALEPGTPGEVAVMVIDLDDFKGVNDTFGHPIGDELLRGVASRLTGSGGPDDVVARLDGDAFAVLVRSPSDIERRVVELAERTVQCVRPAGHRRRRAARRRPQHRSRHEPPLADQRRRPAVGRQRGHVRREGGRQAALLGLHARDARLDRPPPRPQGRARASDRAATSSSSSTSRSSISSPARRSPSRRSCAGTIRAAAASLRSSSSRSRRTTGLIVPLGRYVLEEACTRVAERHPDVQVQVNLSAIELEQPDLLDDDHGRDRAHRHRSGPARARGHRDAAGQGRRARRRDAAAAARPRRAARARRLRHRLLLAQLPAQPAARQPQDRARVRRGHGLLRPRRRVRAPDRRPREDHRPQGRRRRASRPARSSTCCARSAATSARATTSPSRWTSTRTGSPRAPGAPQPCEPTARSAALHRALRWRSAEDSDKHPREALRACRRFR